MSLNFKQNRCPNRLTTQSDAHSVIQSIYALQKVYSEQQFKLATQMTFQSDDEEQLSSLLHIINEKHEQNRMEMNELIEEFLSRYQKITGQTYENEENQPIKIAQSSLSIVERWLSRIESITIDDIEDMREMKLKEICSVIQQKCGISKSEQLDVLITLNITEASEYVDLIETEELRVHPMKNQKWNEVNSNIENYLNSELGQLSVCILFEKLAQAKTFREEYSVEQLVSNKEMSIFTQLVQTCRQTNPQLSENTVIQQPQQIRELYSQYKIIKEVERAEKQELSIQFMQCKGKLIKFCQSKNYGQILEQQFMKADKVRSGFVNYVQFQKILTKIKLLSPCEISILFKGCLMSQKNVIRSIINKKQCVEYDKFLNEILLTKCNKKQHNSVDTNLMKKQVQNCQHIIKALSQEKQELLIFLMEKDEELKKSKKQLIRSNIEDVSQLEEQIRRLNNELLINKVKTQAEIKKLNGVIDNQNRIMESYRIELEHIMNQIH